MTNMLRAVCVLVTVACLATANTGCQTYKSQTKTMTSSVETCNAHLAAEQFGRRAAKCGDNDLIVWHLEAAEAYLAAGDYTNSNAHFDAAGAQADKFEQDPKYSVSGEFAALLTNQQNLPYKGRTYDKIMLYTHRAINYLELGYIDKARPELIRAYQCQQDAVEDNKRRIEKAEEAEQQRRDHAAIESAKANPACAAQLDGMTNNLDGFKFYADYVNPFTVYLDGLYFLYAGTGESDLEHARKSFSRLIDVVGSNSLLESDLQLIESGSNTQLTPCTYIIFETGEAASRTQVKVNIPFSVNGQFILIGAALPKLVFHKDYAPQLTVKASDIEDNTTVIADMDAIVAQDFKAEWPVILTKSMISTAMKATAQAEAKNDFARLGIIAYQEMTNIADTRGWTTLPKEFQVARINTPADRKIVLSTPNSAPAEVSLMDGLVNVVYVKSFTASCPLLVSQFKLK